MRFLGQRMLGASIAVLAVSLLAGCSSGRYNVSAPGSSATSVPASVALKPVVVAIGDSIMKGHGLKASQAWPALIAKDNGWSLTNLACDGAGFATNGDADDCDSDFSGLVAKAIRLEPTLILISGSSNDLGEDDALLDQHTSGLIDWLHQKLPAATIVGISTIWNDTATPTQVDDISEEVRQATLAVNGTYLNVGQPLAGHREWLQSDDVHPTAKGQEVLATRIADSLRSAKLSF